MRVLLVHNAYQRQGGEDVVVANEKALLESGGHEVELLLANNHDITGTGAAAKAALGTLYSRSGRERVDQAIRKFTPEIVHVHNHFPLLSPSIFDATAAAGVPSVWTLHNYRVACANGLLFRNDKPCEDCLGRLPLPGIVNRCYRGSLAGSAVVSASIAYHRARGTWHRKVNRFIALSAFARAKLEAAGIPAERLTIKPNFTPDTDIAPLRNRKGFVFVGRLSREKGVCTLITAWQNIDLPLTIIGDGPQMAALREKAPPHVRLLGHQDKADVHAAIAGAEAIIVPSVWYEGLPMVVIEAMALGTPIIASRIGTLADAVTDGVDGYHFDVGNGADLVRVLMSAKSHPHRLAELGAAARLTYERDYSPAANLTKLIKVYRDAAGHPLRSAA